MKRPLVLILAAALLLPLGSTLWMGFQALERDRDNQERRLKAALQLKLDLISKGFLDRLSQVTSVLDSLLEAQDRSNEALQGVSRSHPLVSRGFLLQGTEIIVPPLGNRTLQEEQDCQDLAALLESGPLWGPPEESRLSYVPPASGWAVDRGRDETIYRWRRQGQEILVLRLNRGAFLAELLPPPQPPAEETILLKDSFGRVFFSWGQEKKGAVTLIRQPLSVPLETWFWEVSLSPDLFPTWGKPNYDLIIYPSLILAFILVLLFFWLKNEIGRDLKEAEQRVSFVNRVSHELKTPLTNLQLYADLAVQGLGSPGGPSPQHLEIIQAETRRLGRMIHNVLTFSRKDKQDQPRLRSLNPGDLLQTLIPSFTPSLQARNLILEVKLGPTTRIWADQDWTEQILYNLLSNAEKYGCSGGRIFLTWVLEAPGFISFLLRDWGPGIPPKDREKVFLPFVRLSDKVTDGVTGTGLGLAIARDLARRMGGQLTYQEVTPGACFRLDLPQIPESEVLGENSHR